MNILNLLKILLLNFRHFGQGEETGINVYSSLFRSPKSFRGGRWGCFATKQRSSLLLVVCIQILKRNVGMVRSTLFITFCSIFVWFVVFLVHYTVFVIISYTRVLFRCIYFGTCNQFSIFDQRFVYAVLVSNLQYILYFNDINHSRLCVAPIAFSLSVGLNRSQN